MQGAGCEKQTTCSVSLFSSVHILTVGLRGVGLSEVDCIVLMGSIFTSQRLSKNTLPTHAIFYSQHIILSYTYCDTKTKQTCVIDYFVLSCIFNNCRWNHRKHWEYHPLVVGNDGIQLFAEFLQLAFPEVITSLLGEPLQELCKLL